MKVVVVGAGIIGLLTAHELSLRGLDVTVVDAGDARPPASWAGGGILSPLYPWRYPDSLTALARGAHAAYQTIAETICQAGLMDPEIHACGMRVLDEPNPSRALAWAAENKVALELDGDTLLLPSVSAIRNSRLLEGLFGLLRQQGVTFRSGRVSRIEYQGQLPVAWVGERRFQADRLVLCAGAWSAGLLADVGINLPLRPVKGQMLRYQLEKTVAPASILLGYGGYLIPRRDGSLLVGSTLEPEVFDQRPTQAGCTELLAVAANLMPALVEQQPVAQWAGLRPGNDRATPWIGSVPGHDAMLVAVGHYRNGLVCGPATAGLLSRLVVGESPDIDPQPYALPR